MVRGPVLLTLALTTLVSGCALLRAGVPSLICHSTMRRKASSSRLPFLNCVISAVNDPLNMCPLPLSLRSFIFVSRDQYQREICPGALLSPHRAASCVALSLAGPLGIFAARG